MNEKTSYPLSWPDVWPRTPRNQVAASRFGRLTAQGKHSMARVRTELADEIRRLGATDVILSTNVELRLDGLPFSNRISPADCGAAVYFKLKGKNVSLACDRWNRVEDNIWAIIKKIYNIREDERNGVGNIEQAFRGYMALAETTSGISWWSVLGVPINATAEQVKEAYFLLVKKYHPDGNPSGGDEELLRRVITAYEMFEATLKS